MELRIAPLSLAHLEMTFVQLGDRSCLEFALHAKPRYRFIPSNRFQHAVWSLVTSEAFELGVFGLILLNTMILGVKFHGQTEIYGASLDYLNLILSEFFLAECVLKLIAFNFKHYFSDGWNILDFILVLGSVVDNVFLAVNGTLSEHQSIHFFRIFRALRLIKLLARGEQMRVLMWTFLRSLRALPYVLLLIVMVFFIFAVVGMQMFGKIQLNVGDSAITEHNNFRSFPQAMMLLFRCATGESWHHIMISVANRPSVLCEIIPGDEESSTGCGSNFAYAFFPAFELICSFMILNILVAVITENFDYLTQDWSLLGPQHLDEFVRLWAEYDPSATGRIAHKDVVSMLRQLDPPLGIGRCCPRKIARKKLLAMNMPMAVDGTVTFNATFVAVVRTALGIHTDGPPDARNSRLRRAIRTVWKKYPEAKLDEIVPQVGDDHLTVGTFYATTIMQDYYRRKFKRLRVTLSKSEAVDL